MLMYISIRRDPVGNVRWCASKRTLFLRPVWEIWTLFLRPNVYYVVSV